MEVKIQKNVAEVDDRDREIVKTQKSFTQKKTKNVGVIAFFVGD